MQSESCDLLVVGTGAAGLTAAVTARKAGLSVLIVEKEACFGGTTAASGGVLWIPGNHHSQATARALGVQDSIEAARRYLVRETGNFMDADRIDAYLGRGKDMVAWLEAETEVEFYGMTYPDYHMGDPDSTVIRSVGTVGYSTNKMGAHLKTMKNQLPQTLFLGLAIGSSVEMKEFMQAGRSIRSMGFVLRKMAGHFFHLARYGHSEEIVRGRALVARLARTAFDLGIPMWLSSPARELVTEHGRVVGAVIDRAGGPMLVNAAKGVVLACGGYPKDEARRRGTYPKPAAGAEHPSVVPNGNTGDGVRMAEGAGGQFTSAVATPGSWMPVSKLPRATDQNGTWPHLVDRQKPGFIAVLRNGKRFTSESSNYHDFIRDLIRACEPDQEAAAFLIADRRAVKRWGMGFARPFPVPHENYVRSGYLLRAKTIGELAAKASIDKAGLEKTVSDFNLYARTGVDPDFHRGESVYDLYQGEEENKPNPCLAPLQQAPYYAVRLYAGEIGTFAGLKADRFGRVLAEKGEPVPGLYAAGNDQANVFAGAYPGAGSTLGPAMTFAWLAARHAAGLEG